jgi:hypothetical protein
MPEQQRAPRLDEIDVAGSVGVDEVRALAANGEPGNTADSAERPNR